MSVVVSNIAKNISTDYIAEYLADELKLSKDNIRVTPLAPAGKNMDDLTYLQYRVSTPASSYPQLKSSGTWPKGVRVRDFIINKRTNVASLDNFLLKKSAHAPIETTTPSTEQFNPADPPSDELIEIDLSSSSLTA